MKEKMWVRLPSYRQKVKVAQVVERRVEALASVVRLHSSTQHGVSSSIGRASVCEAEGSGIVTHLTHKKVR